jgi:uncharacterized protein (TIGR02217 family)
MSFYEIRFPEDISSGSKGGPGFSTNVVTLDSGHEKRRIIWPLPRYSYDVVFGVKKPEQMEELIEFFYYMRGKAYGFRFKDPLDHKSCPVKEDAAADDQILVASATGGETTIQLIKTYSTLVGSIDRVINKPVEGTVVLEKNSTPLTETVDYTVDHATGIVTLVVPLVATDEVTGGFEFDVPCRFDTDDLDISLNSALVGDTTIPVIELKL